MYRSIYSDLVNWKNSKRRKPLVLNGVHQIGKTHVIKEFGRREYDSYVYINCDNNPYINDIFYDFDIKRIIRDLSALVDTNISEGKTLIIFDEVQECPLALTSLKYFCEDAKDYHVAVAGSLLGLMSHEGSGFPVGKIDELNMYPMSFEEFLLALGKDNLVEIIKERNYEKIESFHKMLTDYLREYYFVGGMPEAVQDYVLYKDVVAVRNIQHNILLGYAQDISKHVPKLLLPKVMMVWDSLCSQLSKENKKFKYSELKKGGRAKEFEDAIIWLIKAGLVYQVYKIDKIDSPLHFYEDQSSFKLYMLDLGLFAAKARASAKDILISNNIFKEYKGSFTEQYVLQEMIYDGLLPNYYSNETSTIEIDFVLEDEGGIHPIEVKAEENLKSNSLNKILKDRDLIAYKFSMRPYKANEKIINVPLYLVGEFLREKSSE